MSLGLCYLLSKPLTYRVTNTLTLIVLTLTARNSPTVQSFIRLSVRVVSYHLPPYPPPLTKGLSCGSAII